MVRVWFYHHRCCRFFVAYGGSVYHRYATDDSTRNFHVKYALCMQVSAPFFISFRKTLLIQCLTTFPVVRCHIICAVSKKITIRSILYKTKLPFILVFNKTDVQPHDFALEWMSDFEEFQAALASHSGTRDSEGEPTYMNSLMNSMSLVLDEFYKNLKVGKNFLAFFGLNNIRF